MKFGAKVSFDKCYIDTGLYVDFDNLDEKQQEQNDEHGYVLLTRKTVRDFGKELCGVVIGTRSTVITSRISKEMMSDPDAGRWERVGNYPDNVRKAYKVAVGLNRAYWVDVDWLKEQTP